MTTLKGFGAVIDMICLEKGSASEFGWGILTPEE